jgi:uncharacterized protein (DUF1501 family)
MLAMGQTAAQTATDYKALVCVFLTGGNDAFNTVLATDTASWAAYTSVRRQAPTPIDLMGPGTPADLTKAVGSPEWLGGVLPMSVLNAPVGRSFALHPRLTSLQRLFNTDRRLAVVANVGPLIQPTTKNDYRTARLPLPAKLYSHNDQQNMWQALATEGATTGWGGRILDGFVPPSQSPNMYASISVAGNAVWLSGTKVRQYQMSPSGAIVMGGSTQIYGAPSVANALKRITSNGLAGPQAPGSPRSAHVLMADLGDIARRSLDAESVISSALANMPTTDPAVGPDSRLQMTDLDGKTIENPLARQLQAVARLIAVRSNFGVGRQVFFVQLGGFDTHDGQNKRHAELMARLDHALAYFDDSLGRIGVRSQVTTFTASDFGRTFTSNGDGTDHGWGGHHFVMGGAVKGGKIYGTFPTLGVKNTANNQFDASPDQLTNGVLLPTTSLDQYGMTFASWFGANNASQIFRNASNFSASRLDFL